MTVHLDIPELLEKIKIAARGDDAPRAVRALMEQAVADPAALAEAFPDYGADEILFEDGTVSIWYCHFHPGLSVPAHDHRVSATIGVFRGQERNDFFEAAPEGGIRKSSDVVLGPGDVLSIGPSAIHSVTCISDTPCNGLHVYLGELTKTDRSLYDIDSGEVMPFDDDNYERLMASDRFSG